MKNQLILLFQDTTIAKEIGYMLRAKFDGLNAIELPEPVDRVAVKTALDLWRAEFCQLGESCLWFAFQLAKIEVELNRLNYKICCPLEETNNFNIIYVLLESLESEANGTKRRVHYYCDIQKLCFECQMCEYIISPTFTEVRVFKNEGDWAEAALLPQGLPEGKIGLEGISTEIHVAAKWVTNLLKKQRQEEVKIRRQILPFKMNMNSYLFTSKQLKAFELALREKIAEKIAWAGYNPINPSENSIKRQITCFCSFNHYSDEIKEAASITQMSLYFPFVLNKRQAYIIEIDPGLVTVKSLFSDHFVIYKCFSKSKSNKLLQSLLDLINDLKKITERLRLVFKFKRSIKVF